MHMFACKKRGVCGGHRQMHPKKLFLLVSSCLWVFCFVFVFGFFTFSYSLSFIDPPIRGGSGWKACFLLIFLKLSLEMVYPTIGLDGKRCRRIRKDRER